MKEDKIGIDFTFISNEEITGGRLTGSMSVFTADILRGIKKLGLEKKFAIIVNSIAEEFIRCEFPTFEVCSIGGWLSKTCFFLLKKQISGRRLKKAGVYNRFLQKNNIRRIYYPWMVPEETEPVDCEFIGTCHDLKMRRANSDEACFKMFNNSRKIVVISDYVKNQVVNTYSLDPDKLIVIPNCVALTEDEVEVKSISELCGRKFILDVNAYNEEKNTLTMINAFGRIADKVKCSLVLCGGYGNRNYMDECRSRIRTLGLSERIFMFYNIPEEEKNWLFKNCMLFVTPSENEGFGRTPIEAALCMKPVISTKSTSLGEVTADRLNYYEEPGNDAELADKILEVISNPVSTEKLSDNKNFFSERYSLERVAEMYIKVFSEISWL